MSSIKNGFLIATPEETKKILKKLKKDISKNPILKERFNRNPGEVLGERGLSIPIQRELNREKALVEICILTLPCLCTNCGLSLSA